MIEVIKKNRSYFAYAFVFTLMAHFIKFVNYYPTWDSMFAIELKWGDMIPSGRWFGAPPAIILSSKYDLQWVAGIVAAFFISVLSVLIVELFDIKQKLSRLIAISLFSVFPTFASSFSYGFMIPTYMLALSFACFAVFVCIKGNKKAGLAIAIILMTLSLGAYQIYLLFATAMMAIFVAKMLLQKECDKNMIKRIVIRFLITVIASLLLYFIINKSLQIIFGQNLSDNQGIDQIGIMSAENLISGVGKIIVSTGSFFLGKKAVTVYGIINVVIIILFVILYFNKVLLNKEYKVSHKLLITVLFVGVIPITYAYYLVSPGVLYHRVMELGNYLVYFIAIILLDMEKPEEEFKLFRIKTVLPILLCVLTFYHFVNDNIAYHQMSISYEKTYYEISELMTRIDEANPDQLKKLCIVGNFQYGDEDDIYTIPQITGANTDNFLHDERHIFLFANHYLNRPYVSCTEEEKERILAKTDIDKLSAFPYGNCIEIVDDIIVVKLPGRNY